VKKIFFLILFIFSSFNLNSSIRRKLDRRTPVEEFVLDKRLSRPLINSGIKTFGDLLGYLEKNDLIEIKGIGPKTKKQIDDVIDPILVENQELLAKEDPGFINKIISFVKQAYDSLFQTEGVIKIDQEVIKDENIRDSLDIKANLPINSGIKNPGNRCYLISLLQCLSQIEGFYIPDFNLNTLKLSESLINLSNDFLKYISGLLYEEPFSRKGMQQDSTALYTLLVANIEFMGSNIKLNEVLKNLNTTDLKVRENTETVIYLSPSQKERSVQVLLNDYFAAKEVLNDYSWNDDGLFDIPVEKSFEFIGSSDYLVSALKIFDNLGNKLKFRTRIDEIINLGRSDYEISGIVLHSGKNIQSGHYISIIKQNGSYYVYNDSKVSGPFDDLDSALDSVSRFDVYVLFYKRIN
jgi:hypothetical protein